MSRMRVYKMVMVTDKNYSMEKAMVRFMDLIADRISKPAPKLDYALLVDGYEGYGKSNFSAGLCYYIAQKTGREYTLNNVFFDPEEMLRAALTKSNQIIHWDEMALAALSKQHHTKIQLALIQMLYMARKKRHLFVFDIPRFYRLNQQVIERCMGLVHVYLRKNNTLGNFYFYNSKGLKSLNEFYMKTRRVPNFNMHIRIRGHFGEALPLILDENEYEKKKDEGLKKVMEVFGTKKTPAEHATKKRLDFIKKKTAEFLVKRRLLEEYEKDTKINPKTVYYWKENLLVTPEITTPPVSELQDEPNLIDGS